MFFVGLLVLILGLVVSVAIHELGHMLPAKKFGAMVPEYWVGFGPTIWSTKRGQTRYGIKALPLGGYVRILGMFPPASAVAKSETGGRGARAIAQARQQSEAEVQAAKEEGIEGIPFYQLSTPKKLIVMLAGPLTNLVFAFLLITVVLVGIGWNGPSTTIEDVEALQGQDSSPALDAGLQPGDRVVAVDGVSTPDWLTVTDQIQAAGQTRVVVEVLRDGKRIEVEMVPQQTEQGPKIGIVSALERQRGTPKEAAEHTWQNVTLTGKAIFGLPVGLYELTKSIVTGEERDPNGVLSVVGVARIAGEITSADAGASGEQPQSGTGGLSGVDRFALLLSLLASLNIALFVFNLIPLPPLDGGHVAGASWGGIRNLWAKFRGRPVPPPADTARMVPLTYTVFIILMVMTVLLVFADLVKPLSLA